MAAVLLTIDEGGFAADEEPARVPWPPSEETALRANKQAFRDALGLLQQFAQRPDEGLLSAFVHLALRPIV